jgi:hypothetical protein
MKKYIIFAVLGVIIFVSGVTYTFRDTLKGYFEIGDKPSEEQFGDVIDSAMNMIDDGITVDAKAVAPTKGSNSGDTSVKSEPLSEAKVLTQSQVEFKLTTVQPVTFRWTPVVPKPAEPVSYRLKVWQLMQGQSSSQAMKTNPPIVTKDVADITEATVSNIYTGPCRPPYLCEYVWSVEVQVKDTTTGSGVGAGSAPDTGSGTGTQ